MPSSTASKDYSSEITQSPGTDVAEDATNTQRNHVNTEKSREQDSSATPINETNTASRLTGRREVLPLVIIITALTVSLLVLATLVFIKIKYKKKQAESQVPYRGNNTVLVEEDNSMVPTEITNFCLTQDEEAGETEV
ncbi:uncharacterized protein O3C94_001253 [Discoglossus pictus]